MRIFTGKHIELPLWLIYAWMGMMIAGGIYIVVLDEQLNECRGVLELRAENFGEQ